MSPLCLCHGKRTEAFYWNEIYLKSLLLACWSNPVLQNNYPCILCFLELLHSLESRLVIHLLKYFYFAQDRLGCVILLLAALSCLLTLWGKDWNGGFQYRLAEGRFCCDRRRRTLGRCPGNFVTGNSGRGVWHVFIGSGIVKGVFSLLGPGLQRAMTYVQLKLSFYGHIDISDLIHSISWSVSRDGQ